MDNNIYQKLTVRVSIQWEDIWIAHCFENGASGIETEKEEEKFSILHVFFTNMSINTSLIIESFFQIYESTSKDVVLINNEILKNKNWLKEWKRFFHPIVIGKKFIVCPPWEIPDNRDHFYKIIINPGNGFGSGSHPSTELALKLLETYHKHMGHSVQSLLDIGTGSGILLIAAKHLGFTQLTGIDIDLPSIYNARNNFLMNQITGIRTICGRPDCIHHSFDIVISNMMLHELSTVKNDLVNHMKKTGVLIVSGFYIFQKEKLFQCFKSLNPIIEMTKDEWCGIVFQSNDGKL
jgi:ribosomal protein L11 methyltransferase